MPDRMIAHYRVIRPLGAGGMGEVFLGQDTRLDRSVALKIMAAELAKSPEQRKRFRQEARAASGLVHPNICVIHEVGETEEGRPFLAMEYVEGQLLDSAMRRRRLRLREVVRIGLQVADALQSAHDRGIVHRDIKPSNIMLDARGNVKVLDFGLAKRFGPEAPGAPADSESSLLQTQTGVLLGTPHYMSPEQALGRSIDHRSDIFSLGVVLYELAAGQKPFLGNTLGEAINNVVNQPPEPLALDHPVFHPALDEILLKCLEKDPTRRYPSARELGADLERLLAEADRAATARNPAPATVPVKDPPPARYWPLPRRRVLDGPAIWVMAAVAVVALAWALYVTRPGKPGQGTALPPVAAPASAAPIPQKSVAVLPFDNFSAEKDTEYLSDGLTEEITTELSRIPGLKVAARNSAFAFKGRKEDLRKVGATLGVTTILEGSLRKAGQQLRVTAQLINVADGYHLWSETYERSIDDIFAVQVEIARKIADRLQIGQGSGATNAARLASVNAEAHTLYLQARHYWNRRGKDNLERAAQLFTQAIDRDPTYAAAHEGLASTYLVMPGYLLRPESEYLPLARAAATRALELDPTSSSAIAVEAHAEMVDRHPERAEELMKRALALNPNNATAHHWYGVMLREYDRLDEAIGELQRAEELDPLSPIIKLNLVLCHWYRRDTERVRSDLQRYARLFPDSSMILHALGVAYVEDGRFPEGLDLLTRARDMEQESPQFLDSLGYAQALSGDPAAARRTLAELNTWLDLGYAVHGGIAKIHLGLKEPEQAIDALERAFAAGENLVGLKHEASFDGLRSNPRFQALCKNLTKAP